MQATVTIDHRRARRTLQLAEEWQGAMGGGDLRAALAWLAEDIEIVVPPSLPHGGSWHGHQGFTDMLAQFRGTWEFDHPLSFELIDAGDDLVVVHATGTVRSRSTGREAYVSTAEFLTVAEGKIARIDVYYSDVAQIVPAVYQVED